MKTRPYSISALAEGRYGLRIFGEIGYDRLAEDFARDLEALDGADLEVRINSIGGSVYDGLPMYNQLLAHPGKVTVVIEGLAASMASVIAMAGDVIQAYAASQIMIHRPYGSTAGNASQHQQRGEQLAQMEALLIDIYAKRTGQPRKQIERWMADETWFTAEAAQRAGFIDAVLDDDFDIAACARELDLSAFANAPGHLLELTMSDKTTPAQPENKVDAQAVLAAERDRCQQIQTLVARHADCPETGHQFLAMQNKAITEGWPVEKVGHAMLNLMGSLSGGPTGGVVPVHVEDRRADFRSAIVDQLAMRNGCRIEEPHPSAADLSRMSIVNIAEQCLRQAGVSEMPRSTTRLISAAFSHSSSDFPGILEDVLHKMLHDGYQGEPDTTAGWTRPSDLRDFREVRRIQMSEGPGLELVPEGGEYTEGTFKDRSEKYALSTYGRIFAATRQMLINDDLAAFTRVPQAFGQSVRRKHLDLTWGKITGNGAMSDGNALFSSAHSNLAASGSALSVTSLSEGRKAMRMQKGEQGLQVLNIVPRYLLVPAALESQAEELIASLIPPGSTDQSPSLAFVRSLQLVVEPRLDADSETAWYLVADPAQISTLEQGFLGGTEFEIEEHMGFEIDGRAWKVRTDFGCAPLDWRGFYKNAGA